MRKIDRFFYYFNESYQDKQPKEKVRRVKTLISFSFFLAFILYSYSLGTYLKLEHIQLSLIEFIIGTLSFGVPFFYKRTGNFELSSNMTVFCATAILSLATLYSGGIDSPVVFWVALVPMGAGMIRGKGSVVKWGIVCLCIPIFYAIFDDQVQKFPYMIRDKELLFALRTRVIYGTLIFSIVLNWMYKKFIEDMVTQLTDANIQIQNFIRVLGHDIANPLTIVIGNSTMGEKVATSEKEKRLWKRTSKASKTIDEILKEVLTLQAIESGKIQLKLSPVSLEEIFERGKFVFSEKLEDKKLELEYVGETDLFVLADEVSLSNQVLNNLISNAIKFSDKGSKIQVNSYVREDDVIIEVRDTGVGIPDDILDNLFDYHYKTSRPGTLGEKGTGFGMPLVKHFIEQYGGRLDVETKPIEKYTDEHGTVFKITLKRAFLARNADAV